MIKKLYQTVFPPRLREWIWCRKDGIVSWFCYKRQFIIFPLMVLFFRKRRRPAPRYILCYPEQPIFMFAAHKMFRLLNLRLVTDPAGDFDLAIHWEDTTKRSESTEFQELSARQRVINKDCLDISKERVQTVFKEVFGYDLAVDPLTYEGAVVQKSDTNATHDGRVLQAPLQEIEEGMVYQKLIDSQAGENWVFEWRVPVIGKNIPCVYYKRTHVDNRFYPDCVSAELNLTKEVFSVQEVEKILEFSGRLGLDLGELDILRDRNDGRLYIVDANNTPVGPPRRLSVLEHNRALVLTADAFYEAFLAVLPIR